MTDDPSAQMLAFIAAIDPGWRYPRNPADNEDEETLRRSRGGLSRDGRSKSRRPRIDRPTEPWADSLAVCNPNAVAS